MTRPQVVGAAIAGVLGLIAAAAAADSAKTTAPVRLPLEEARRMVRMMDDIYISGVLTTHRMYVQEPGVPAAVAWAKQVVREVRAKGWPDAHIFDTTGRPLNPENAPADSFEQEAIRAFRKGQPHYEKVENGAFRFATAITISERSCITCHVRAREGDLIGGVSYRALLAAK
jgi:hypothetical protein